MSWVRVDDKFPRHPKVIALCAQSAALWMAACCWCSEFETDGALPAAAVPHLSWYTPEAVEELERAGLWRKTETGWQVHDYLKFNPSRRDKQEKRDREQARFLRSKRGQSAEVLPAETQQSARLPIPLPHSPSPKKKEQPSLLGDLDKGQAEQVLDLLNAARKRVIDKARAYKPTPANLKHIGDRLREGHTVEDCAHVIAVCEAATKAKPENGEWFDAITPFRPDNFARNFGRTPKSADAKPTKPQRLDILAHLRTEEESDA